MLNSQLTIDDTTEPTYRYGPVEFSGVGDDHINTATITREGGTAQTASSADAGDDGKFRSCSLFAPTVQNACTISAIAPSSGDQQVVVLLVHDPLQAVIQLGAGSCINPAMLVDISPDPYPRTNRNDGISMTCFR